MSLTHRFPTLMILALLILTASPAPAAARDMRDLAIDLSNSRITEFIPPTPKSQPYGLTFGPDGNLWFTESGGNKIGRINLNDLGKPASPDAAIDEFPIPTAGSTPAYITAGPDGNLWFTEYMSHKIGRITPAGVFTEYPISATSNPIDITTGPDGYLWYLDDTDGNVGKMSPAGALLGEYPIPTDFSGPNMIILGPDGNLWFTEYGGRKIGRITPTGVITEYPIPSTGKVFGLAVGPDGNLWFTETNGNRVGKLTLAGAFTEYNLPDPAQGPQGIVTADGHLWVVGNTTNTILRLSLDGAVINQYPIPTAGSGPVDIVLGPDRALWFTEMTGNKIGRLALDHAIYLPVIKK